MNKIEDLRIGQIVYFENGDMLEITGLNKFKEFPVQLKGDKNGYDGDYTLDAFLIEKPKQKIKRKGFIGIKNGLIDEYCRYASNIYLNEYEIPKHYKIVIPIEWEEEE